MATLTDKMAALDGKESEAGETAVSGTASPLPLDSLQDMEDSALVDLLQQTKSSNSLCVVENEIFERFLKRLDPRDVQTRAVPGVQSSLMELRAQRKKVKSRSSSIVEKVQRLTMEQKCDIATRELDELRDAKQKREEELERTLDNHRAVIAEADIRLAEMKKSEYEFDRDIVRGAVNPRTGQILGEKVVRYFEERLKLRDSQAEKLRLKNAALRVRRRKLQVQLKQKEEAGEIRHEVDFDQLQIENSQLNERFEEKNRELLQLKLDAGNTMQVLNSYKKKLQTLSLESRQLDGDIGQRRELAGRVGEEMRAVTREREKAEGENAEARRKLEDYRVPDVMEYVHEQASLYELTKTVRAWERKVEIAEMTLRTYKQTWQRLYQQSMQVSASQRDSMQAVQY